MMNNANSFIYYLYSWYFLVKFVFLINYRRIRIFTSMSILKVRIYILATVLSLFGVSYANASDSTYINAVFVNHNLAMKICHIDNLFNLSIGEFDKFTDTRYEKFEAIRFNYWVNDSTCRIIYGNPNSLVKPLIAGFEANSDSTVAETAVPNSELSLIRAIAQMLTGKQDLIAENFKNHIDLSNYIVNKSDTFSLYLIPTWQRSGFVVNASEYHYRYIYNKNKSEMQLLDSNIIIREPLYYKVESQEIVLNYNELEVPPVGAFVFSILYHDYFKRIVLESKEKKSYLMDIFDGSYVHSNKN